jgi:hypothetical protein
VSILFPTFVLTSEHECIYCARWPPGSLEPLPGQRANEGLLTNDERAKYEALINAADFISILKRKARRHLDSE